MNQLGDQNCFGAFDSFDPEISRRFAESLTLDEHALNSSTKPLITANTQLRQSIATSTPLVYSIASLTTWNPPPPKPLPPPPTANPPTTTSSCNPPSTKTNSLSAVHTTASIPPFPTKDQIGSYPVSNPTSVPASFSTSTTSSTSTSSWKIDHNNNGNSSAPNNNAVSSQRSSLLEAIDPHNRYGHLLYPDTCPPTATNTSTNGKYNATSSSTISSCPTPNTDLITTNVSSINTTSSKPKNSLYGNRQLLATNIPQTPTGNNPHNHFVTPNTNSYTSTSANTNTNISGYPSISTSTTNTNTNTSTTIRSKNDKWLDPSFDAYTLDVTHGHDSSYSASNTENNYSYNTTNYSNDNYYNSTRSAAISHSTSNTNNNYTGFNNNSDYNNDSYKSGNYSTKTSYSSTEDTDDDSNDNDDSSKAILHDSIFSPTGYSSRMNPDIENDKKTIERYGFCYILDTY